jgi:hypothetical protein
MFAIRRWTFKGVKEEEWLQAAVCNMATNSMLDDATGEALVNVARVYGRDWLEAVNVLDRRAMTHHLDQLELHLAGAYSRASKRKADENADRLMFQLRGIDQHLANQLSTFEEIRVRHEHAGRGSLAKATQGRIDKLRASVELKREQVRQRERVIPDQTLVCAGVICVEE